MPTPRELASGALWTSCRWVAPLLGGSCLAQRVSAVASLVVDVANTNPNPPDGASGITVFAEELRRSRSNRLISVSLMAYRTEGLSDERDVALMAAACRDPRLMARAHPHVMRSTSFDRSEDTVVRSAEVWIETAPRPTSATLRLAVARATREARRAALLRLRRWLASDRDRPDGATLLAGIDGEIEGLGPDVGPAIR